jgi:RNA polymerase subunit RPABC4/transcription elongation factor Spt4
MEKKGSALYLCPGCGAFVSESASKCPNCGNALEGSADEDLDLPDVDKAQAPTIEAKPEIVEIEKEHVDEESEPVTLFLCSACGAFTGGDADNCPNCGTSMRDDDAGDIKPLIKPGDPESDLLDMLVTSESDDSENLLEDLKKIESTEDVESFIESIPYKDPDVILDLDAHAADLPESSEDADDLLSQLILISDDRAEPVQSEARPEAVQRVKDILAAESRRVSLDDNTSIAMCSSCGAFVSESAEVCNICGNALKGDKKFIPGAKPKIPDMDTSDDDAESIMRTLLGVKEDAELDKDAGTRFQSDGSLGLCTLCGAFISQAAQACPVCGTHIEDMPEFVPSIDLAGPEKEAHGLALCPHCGVFVQEGAKECFSCVKPIPDGAVLAKYQADAEVDESDRASNLLKTFLGVEKALTMAPLRDPTFSGLDLCPDCGAFVSAQAITCSVCGNPLFEGADEINDINKQINEINAPKCPNCGTDIESSSSECSMCGLAFGSPESSTPLDGPAQDISDFLETELEETIKELEAKANIVEPDVANQQSIKTGGVKDELLDMLVLDEDIPESEIAKSETGDIESIIDESLLETDDLAHDSEPLSDVVPEQDRALESLEFIEQYEVEPSEQETLGDVDEIPFLEDDIATEKTPEPLPAFESHSHVAPKPANWATGVYISTIAITFFIASYLIVPGEYAPGLALIFGTLLIYGIYMWFTDKGSLFKGDLKHASVFIAGTIVSAAVLLHWPAGILTSDSGLMGQPALDRMLLSLSILLICIGLLWIRARVRYVFIWFSGTTLLFLATLMEFTYTGFGNVETSPVILVSGVGACLVFLSLIFLQYERALHTSIESDIVRGDAHYLKKDYKRALVSYDDALAKAQLKSVEALGSPIVQYDVPWYSKGSALILMGQPEEGIKCLDMALAINPNNEITWVNKGNAHSKLGEHDVARECYRRAIESNPFYEIAWNNMGNVFARQKDYLEALKHYNRAIKINSKYDDAWINKGYVLAKMGKREQAINCLNHVGVRAKGQIPKMERDVHTV